MNRQRMNGDEPSHPIYLWNGVLEQKHVTNIGPAVWLFLWCIDRTTEERPTKKPNETSGAYEGWVYGGMPMTLERIAEEMHTSRRSVQRHLERLCEHGYLRITLAPHGLIIRVQNSCRWPKKQESSSSTSASGTPKVAHHLQTLQSVDTLAKVAHVVRQKRPSGVPVLSPPVPKVAHVKRRSSSYGRSNDETTDEAPQTDVCVLPPLVSRSKEQNQPQNQPQPLPVRKEQEQKRRSIWESPEQRAAAYAEVKAATPPDEELERRKAREKKKIEEWKAAHPEQAKPAAVSEVAR